MVVDLARTLSPAAVRRLAELAMAKKTPAVAAVMACNAILDRGWGKPVQPNLHAMAPAAALPIDLNALTDAQRDTLADILLLTAPEPVHEPPTIEGENDGAC